MKTTLETLHASTKKLADGAFKKPVSSILSLCMLAGVAATLISYSQPEAPQVPAEAAAVQAPTMPALRTITDTKGRAIVGTILAKSDKAITFQLKGNTKTFEIQLETLSPDDQAFITTLVPAPEKKTTVLVMMSAIYWRDNNNNDYASQYAATNSYHNAIAQINWLRDNGFEVTVGMEYLIKPNQKTSPPLNKVWLVDKSDLWATSSSMKLMAAINANPAENMHLVEVEKVIMINPIEIVDQYDILWDCTSQSIITHRLNKRQLIVIRESDKKDAKIINFVKDTSSRCSGRADRGKDTPPINYVKTERDVVFYEDRNEPELTDKTREELLKVVKAKVPAPK